MVSSAAQRLVLAARAEKQWFPRSWAFSTAFLQGKHLARLEDVILAPPEGYARKRFAWRLRKPVYGLCSAPKSWYDRLREVAESAGLNCDISDEAVFRLFDKSKEIVGILALYVDDTIGVGTAALYDAMPNVGDILAIGAEKLQKMAYLCMPACESVQLLSQKGPTKESFLLW